MKRTGFTFIEVCIVVVVFAVIITSIYGIFSGSLNTYRRIQNISFKEERVVLALERLSRDLQQICLPAEEELAFVGKSTLITFVAFSKNPPGLSQYTYQFDKRKKELILNQETVEDVLEGKRKKRKTVLAALDGFTLTYFGFDPETEDIFEVETWESEDPPWAIKIEAALAQPRKRRSKAGYVYVASGDKRETLEYDKEVTFTDNTKKITRRVFLPVARHLRP